MFTTLGYFVLIGTVFWIYSLVDTVRSEKQGNFWMVILLFTFIPGTIFYLFLIKPEQSKFKSYCITLIDVLKQTDIQKLGKIVVIDLGFILLISGAFSLYALVLVWMGQPLAEIDFNSLQGEIANEPSAALESSINAVNKTMITFLVSFGFSLLLFIFLFFLIYTLCKGYVWGSIAKKKTDVHFYKNYFLFSIVLYLLLTMVVLVLLFFVQENIFFLLGPIVTIWYYFSIFGNIHFTKTTKVFPSVKGMWWFGLTSFLQIIPVLACFLALYLCLFIGVYFASAIPIPYFANVVLWGGIIFLLAFYKLYLYSVLKQIKAKL